MTATTENLIPFNKRSEGEARALGAKGGKASGETRRRQRDMREAFAALLKKEWPTKQGTMTGAEMLALAKFKKAASGDVRALIDIEDRLYGKPKETLDATVKTQTKAEPGLIALYAKLESLKK
jgi:hypothetical protein